MDTKWKYLGLCDLRSVSIARSLLSPFSVSLTLFILRRQLFQASNPPYSCTTLDWLTRHRLETPKYRTTGRHCAEEIACVACLCSFETDKGYRHRSGSVSVRVKCLVSHTPSEVCRPSYRLWSLAGRHVERSVTALFSSRSVFAVKECTRRSGWKDCQHEGFAGRSDLSALLKMCMNIVKESTWRERHHHPTCTQRGRICTASFCCRGWVELSRASTWPLSYAYERTCECPRNRRCDWRRGGWIPHRRVERRPPPAFTYKWRAR